MNFKKVNEYFRYRLNNFGFTLIELLAVIVILAIIALIATPIVLNIINESKESARLRSAEMYIKGVETSIATATLNEQNIPDREYEIIDGDVCIGIVEVIDEKRTCNGDILKVEMNGETPNGGTVTIENGKIKDIELKYSDKKTVIYNSKKELVFDNKKEQESENNRPYQESENIEVPDLYNNTLTPVIYDGNNWVIADVTKKWYDYSKQQWANVVILNKDSNKKVGDTITVDGDNPDALVMLVWIPRYEYKIEGTYGKGGTSKTSPGEIEVNFITKDTKQPSDTYKIHPAFNFGGEDISGIWVGKFELSLTTKTGNLGCTPESCNESDNLRIIPNKSSLRSNTVSSFFYAIRSMSKSGNTFGIDNNITDTHMMKNSEWGAVAYLSQSKYGKYGNSDYEGREKEVYINNSSTYYTGRSGGSYGGNTAVNTVYTDQTDVTTQYVGPGFYTYDGYLLQYNSNTKVEPETRNMKKIASTTGNIYGIYDMSGGAYEYTMGVFANSDGVKWSGNSSTANSGFKGKVGADGTDIERLEWPDEKYYEVYKAHTGTTITSTTACNGGICYGHALSETASWYQDYANFVGSSRPWFIRGGYCNNGAYAGVFSSNLSNGGALGDYSARVVFSPTT